ncbi:hypothetical protein TGPRC2_295945 [Toxoplasma gondii TgCatPRC2]|uniref:Uncharacterized protein n=11 Tax=Toxoplasma gondii TaxID=5811 RepID=A0A125YJ50_TOXGV|nr:hypothetical protein TGME49_295945 [Toxoplasma gondii ME49]EPR57753.1 hypothetical protein TGGT1_295945 [Toxoplasma gondii GT1]ESS29151.1 hypothetical protein TGVEG_295945 [Toxoplasma gondii VEG]KAF4646244.1 hypothetical protein TGRH88_020310 [Toxoplasma gondii]KFG28398.1 hypothetical protein TGP89_295945 [Toxoplasma gondii p89]KFG35977.1 hypothetical protein TGFOU_295945 [Toxoplasma gondii FOU]KFG37204.1 hypothetical protein TGDOM2_295945 [Toxoplasma gondii GAB2-2007-GAL-DOM2]KFH05938.1 |eukprot:XP_018638542.1 hypothetical protein TGME49_295945 [Toxoplasma gondii ME49]
MSHTSVLAMLTAPLYENRYTSQPPRHERFAASNSARDALTSVRLCRLAVNVRSVSAGDAAQARPYIRFVGVKNSELLNPSQPLHCFTKPREIRRWCDKRDNRNSTRVMLPIGIFRRRLCWSKVLAGARSMHLTEEQDA